MKQKDVFFFFKNFSTFLKKNIVIVLENENIWLSDTYFYLFLKNKLYSFKNSDLEMWHLCWILKTIYLNLVFLFQIDPKVAFPRRAHPKVSLFLTSLLFSVNIAPCWLDKPKSTHSSTVVWAFTNFTLNINVKLPILKDY